MLVFLAIKIPLKESYPCHKLAFFGQALDYMDK